MSATEHVLPPIDPSGRQHEQNEECWCKPTQTVVWEGTEYERRVYTHFRPGQKANRATRRAAIKKVL